MTNTTEHRAVSCSHENSFVYLLDYELNCLKKLFVNFECQCLQTV